MNDQSKTDWKRLFEMTDTDIDLSDIPELDEAFFEGARLFVPGRADAARPNTGEITSRDALK